MLLLLSLLASGCYVQSLHVFYTDDAKIDIPDLMGDWTSQVQMGKPLTRQITSWTFNADTVDTYDEDDVYSELEVVYFKLDDTYFMDFTAGQVVKGQDSLGNSFWGIGVTFVHSLCKLQIANDTLTLIPLDLDWFEKEIQKGTMDVPYIKPDHKDANYIFTATPDVWMEFLKIHKDNEAVFNPKYQFVFQRKPSTQPTEPANPLPRLH